MILTQVSKKKGQPVEPAGPEMLLLTFHSYFDEPLPFTTT